MIDHILNKNRLFSMLFSILGSINSILKLYCNIKVNNKSINDNNK